MSEALCPALSIRRVLFSLRSDDHLSRRPIARELKRRGVRSDGTIGNPACPNPPCVTMSLPSRRFLGATSVPEAFHPHLVALPRRTGFVSVALVLMPLYRICATWMGVTHRAFQ